MTKVKKFDITTFMKFAFSKKRIMIIVLISIIIIIGIIIALILRPKKEDPELQKGIDFIKSEENKDAYAIENLMLSSDYMKQFENLDTWQKLNKIGLALVGDSRIAQFLNREEYNSAYVIADKSTTIKNIPDYLDYLSELNPNYIMFSYGMNDLGMYQFDPDNYWETAEEYIVEYEEYIQEVKAVCPNANICICSILPATEAGTDRQDRWLLIDDWNLVLEQFCKDKGYIYVDSTEVARQHEDLYESDGVHFILEFYDYWVEAIWNALEPYIY